MGPDTGVPGHHVTLSYTATHIATFTSCMSHKEIYKQAEGAHHTVVSNGIWTLSATLPEIFVHFSSSNIVLFWFMLLQEAINTLHTSQLYYQAIIHSIL